MSEFKPVQVLRPALLSVAAVGGFLLGDLLKNDGAKSNKVGVYAAEIICPKAEPLVKIAEDSNSLRSGDFEFTCVDQHGHASQPLDQGQQGFSYAGMIGGARAAPPVDIYVTYNTSGGQADNIESFIHGSGAYDGGQLQLDSASFANGVPIQGISFSKP